MQDSPSPSPSFASGARPRRLSALALLCLVTLATWRCNGAGAPGSAAQVGREEFDEVKKLQVETLARIEKVERAQARAPQAPQAPRGPDASKVYAYPVGDSPVRGAADAAVTIVEISDFQCPFCARAAATIKEVEQHYKKDVRLVFKHNPLSFHQRAMPAAIAAACAHAQGKFWPLADALFADQSKLSDAELEAAAKAAGVDVARFKKCATDAAPKAAIEADQALAAKFGARGTPAFFINGRFLSGAQPLTAFKAVIDEELKKAKDSKLPLASYYAKEIEGKGAQAL